MQLRATPTGAAIGGLSGGSGESHRLVATNEAGVREDDSPRFDPQTAVAGDNQTLNLPYNLHNPGDDPIVEDEALVYSSGGGTAIGGLVDGQTYYAHVIDANSVRLKATEGARRSSR